MSQLPSSSVIPAREYDGNLLETLEALSRALGGKVETMPPGWAESTKDGIKEGRINASISISGGKIGGLMISSLRRNRAFSHLFLPESGNPDPDARALIGAGIKEFNGRGLRRMDLTLSSSSSSKEASAFLEVPSWGFDLKVMDRERMVVKILDTAIPEAPKLPSGYKFGVASDLPLRTLSELDYLAFEASPDKGLVAETIEEDEEGIKALLNGEAGPLIKEGSPSLLASEEDSGQVVVGFVLSMSPAPGMALIADVAVAKAFRGRGLGKALMERALRGLCAKGVTRADLWVTTANLPAKHLYERLGFTTVQREPVFIWTRE